MASINYKELEQFAETTQELQVITLCGSGYTQTQAAAELGFSRRKAQDLIYRVRDRAKVKGVGEEYVSKEKVDDAYYVKGTSTLYDKDGNAKLQWVKTNIQAESLDKIAKAIVESLVDDVDGKAKPVRKQSVMSCENTMNMIIAGDPHIGVYAKTDEGDFGLEENVTLHKNAISHLLEKAPKASQCVILSVGDTLHTDNPSNRTNRSGANLDVDKDWYAAVRATVDLMKYAVNEALKTHDTVTLLNLAGNHDDYSGYCMNLIMDAYYSNEPRVNVDTSEGKFIYHTFGDNLFGFTHGDTAKLTELESIMACDQSEEWWRSHKIWHTGHIHHKTVQEFRNVTVESHRTLAANDRWHMSQGYRSKKEMKLITYDARYGEVSRLIVNPTML